MIAILSVGTSIQRLLNIWADKTLLSSINHQIILIIKIPTKSTMLYCMYKALVYCEFGLSRKNDVKGV
jgi:hypothetical protein